MKLTFELPRRNFGSYLVQKYRALNFMQTDDSTFRAELKRAQFVVFFDKQPLVRTYNTSNRNNHVRNDAKDDSQSNYSNGKAYSLGFVTHEKLKLAAYQHGFNLSLDSMALLDVVPMQGDTNDISEEWLPVVALGLKKEHQNSLTAPLNTARLSADLNGEFMDLRRAYFLIHEPLISSLMAKAQALLRWSNVFKFCPKCSSPLKMKLSKASAECQCGQVFYPTISPVAIVLISDEINEHLLLVRSQRQLPGVYTAVAGFCEAGESIETTVVRESAEEVGVDVYNLRYLNISRCWPFPQNSLMCAFRATAQKSLPISLDVKELEDGRWFSRQEIKDAFRRTMSDPGFFNVNFSKVKSGQFLLVPPYGTVAHDMIKNWLEKDDY